MKKDDFKIGKRIIKSRLIVGTGKYKNFKQTADAVKLQEQTWLPLR
jgi:thiazole synthase ThiGH ThiG subunit